MTPHTPKRLNKTQRELIDALAEGLDIGALLKKFNLTSATFHRWLTSEAFERELHFQQSVARRQSELLLGRNAFNAAQKLIKLTNDTEKPDIARRACLDILSLTSKGSTEPMTETPAPAKVPLDEKTAAAMLDLLTDRPAE